MQNLPTAETYQKEADFMPWGILLKEVIEYVVKNVPNEGKVLDLMCGTGYLLGELQKKRPDITFLGVDLNKEFVEYAQDTYPSISFVIGDVLNWNSREKYDALLCTGGLHHLPHERQREFVARIRDFIKPAGFAIVADPYIGSYSNEEGRKQAAMKLGEEYLQATTANGATEDVVEATRNLIKNDVDLVEFKDSLEHVEPYFKETFSSVNRNKTWPQEETEYGDYWFLLTL